MKQEQQQREDAEKTELEKVQAKLQKAEDDKKNTIALANKRLILAEFKVKAKDANIKYVDDAYKLADLSTVEVDENGNITGIDAVIDTLVKDKPFLLATEEGENKGGTGKIDDKSKDGKGKATTSFGKRLAESKKQMNGENKKSYYFK